MGKKETDAAKVEDPKKETKPGTASGQTTPALQTPSDQTKFGSGGGTDAQKAPEKAGQADKPKFFASPLARKIALERGIPLAEIKGTGPEGRIVKVGIDLTLIWLFSLPFALESRVSIQLEVEN